jgi:hypothetical protein
MQQFPAHALAADAAARDLPASHDGAAILGSSNRVNFHEAAVAIVSSSKHLWTARASHAVLDHISASSRRAAIASR